MNHNFGNITPRNTNNRNVKIVHVDSDPSYEIRSLVERQSTLIQAQNDLIDTLHKRIDTVEEKFESVLILLQELKEVNNELER